MKLFRNEELRKQLYFYLALLFLAFALFLSFSFTAALIAGGFILLAAGYHFFGVYERYSDLSQLSSELDRALHGDVGNYFADFAEGELSILQNELKKLTERLYEKNEILEEERRQMADFLADVSHQIRTPLTALQLTTTSLLEEASTKEQKGHLLEVRRLLNRIDWLVEVLLKLAKLDAGMIAFRKDRISFEELVKKAAEPFEISMELHNQSISTIVTGGFTGDLSWTTEAVGNIVKNCLEHMGDGKKLTILGRENAIYSELLLEDEGAGIAKEDLPHLFERFYKGKNSGEQSVGIGLALCREIITGQKGVIYAENRKTGGARFIIRFYKQNV